MKAAYEDLAVDVTNDGADLEGYQIVERREWETRSVLQNAAFVLILTDILTDYISVISYISVFVIQWFTLVLFYVDVLISFAIKYKRSTYKELCIRPLANEVYVSQFPHQFV